MGAWLVRVATGCLIGLAVLLLGLRSLGPSVIEHQRARIAAAVESALGQPVRAEALRVSWAGWRPRLELRGVRIGSWEQAPLLQFESVDAVLAWRSVWQGEPYFHRLILHAPELQITRRPDGRIALVGWTSAAGTAEPEASAQPAGLRWLLGQRDIQIHGGTLRWRDEVRQAPELRLHALALRIVHEHGRIRLGLQAQAPKAQGGFLDVRLELPPGFTWDTGLPASAQSTARAYVGLTEADARAWAPWLELPAALQAQGRLQVWAERRGAEWVGAEAELALNTLHVHVPDAPHVLRLQDVSASARWQRRDDGDHIEVERLSALLLGDSAATATETSAPTPLGPLSAHVRWQENHGGEVRVSAIELGHWAQLAPRLPVPTEWLSLLHAQAPRGWLHNVKWGWQGTVAQPRDWQLGVEFADLALAAHGAVPGVTGLTGRIKGSAQQGQFELSEGPLAVHLPRVFPQPTLSFERFRAHGHWRQQGEHTHIVLDEAHMANRDTAGHAQGRYTLISGRKGDIDLTAQLDWAHPESVWKYLPHVVNQATRDWVQHSIRGGQVTGASLRLRGALEDFPYREAQQGEFLVRVHIRDTQLKFAENWPEIQGIAGEVRFAGPGMFILAEHARLSAVGLQQVSADVPDLDAPGGQVLNIRGQAQGAAADYLRFIADSPVREHINGLTDGLSAQGDAALDLRIDLPLHDIDRTELAGTVKLAGNRLSWGEAWPALEKLGGTLSFTQNSFAIPQARGETLGAPFTVKADSLAGQGVRFEASGGAQAQALRAWLGEALAPAVSGQAEWQARLTLGKPDLHAELYSDLAGLALDLPPPFNKARDARWPLTARLHWQGTAQPLRVGAQLEQRLAAYLSAQLHEGEAPKWRGALALGQAPLPDLPAAGMAVSLQQPQLDVDAWLERMSAAEEAPPAPSAPHTPDTESAAVTPWLSVLDVRADELKVFEQTLRSVELTAKADPGGWQGRVRSSAADGFFDWRSAGNGALRARLNRFAFPLNGEVTEVAADSLNAGTEADPLASWVVTLEREAAAARHQQDALQRLPALDVVADEFRLNGLNLGRLSVQAINDAQGWSLDALELISDDGHLRGEGRWQPGAQTQLTFVYDVHDIGAQLGRLGFAEAVAGGQARMVGDVAWRGAPVKPHYASLSGRIKLKAEDGQFRKLEPGVGRLLGVLSLQALPRRLSLDFRDVFSEGFAFDSISGSIGLSSGVMHTQELAIVGPAARVSISGTVDLAAETQALEVTVQPTLAESVALGAAAGLINPVAGVVTYLAQKALSDPIEKMFSYVYVVSGTWSDPAVEKAGSAPATPATQPESDE